MSSLFKEYIIILWYMLKNMFFGTKPIQNNYSYVNDSRKIKTYLAIDTCTKLDTMTIFNLKINWFFFQFQISLFIEHIDEEL